MAKVRSLGSSHLDERPDGLVALKLGGYLNIRAREALKDHVSPTPSLPIVHQPTPGGEAARALSSASARHSRSHDVIGDSCE